MKVVNNPALRSIFAIVLGLILVLWPAATINYLVIVIGVLRGLSKNVDARRKENEAFVAATANVPGLGKFVASLGGGAAAANASRAAGTSKEDLERAKRTAKKMWEGRKTTAYLKCPNCGQMLSVPKGKGKIHVTCPKCHAKMETRS